MAISDRTRKLLWGRAANRCAVCRRELSIVPYEGETALVGEECHIVAQSDDGPRADASLSPDTRDEYSNLVLLCATHHREVDQRTDVYTVAKLRELKIAHELWVQHRLHIGVTRPGDDGAPPEFLPRIFDGQALLAVVGARQAFDFQHDDPKTGEEVEAIGSFLQSCQDVGDVWDDIEAAARVRMRFDFSKEVRKLEEIGFWVFGGVWRQTVAFGGSRVKLQTATLKVVRSSNPTIVRLKVEEEAQPGATDNPDNAQ